MYMLSFFDSRNGGGCRLFIFILHARETAKQLAPIVITNPTISVTPPKNVAAVPVKESRANEPYTLDDI
jgi:hypothetical protein